MDKVVMQNLFKGIYKNKRVFVTGHTGFKGSWLVFWLHKMGAIVKGYSLEPDTIPSHWDLLKLPIESVYGEIRNRIKLKKELYDFQPEIIFHLAAQPLVRLSYSDPFETFEVNVMGTLSLLEASRGLKSLKAIVNITTDKCYENKEWVWGYREDEPMGGYDPYSSSKACMEILTSSYRRSFFNNNDYGKSHNVLLASVRAGNVIGGGDWAKDRLVPDIMKATSKNEIVNIRNPFATRPWQYVLEPLSGYLLLGMNLLEGKKEFAEAWNFGPEYQATLTVKEVINYLKLSWDKINIEYKENYDLHEAGLLKLDCTKAHNLLNWFNVLNSEQTFQLTTNWYRNFYTNNKINTSQDFENYIKIAITSNQIWTE